MILLKKFFTYLLLILIGVALGVSASLGTYYISGDVLFKKTVGTRSGTEIVSIKADATNAELTEYANKVLKFIKAGDYGDLSHVIHPGYGVVFSPYATISLS